MCPSAKEQSADRSKPVSGYEYDTLAEDLSKLMIKLDLRDAVLVCFSMGGREAHV